MGKKTIDEGLAEQGMCPLCEQPADHDHLKEQLGLRLQRLRESKTKYDLTLARKANAVAELVSVSRAGSEAIARASGAGSTPETIELIRNYKNTADGLATKITESFAKYEPVTSNLDVETSELMVALKASVAKLDSELQALELSKEQQTLIDLIRELEKLRDVYGRWSTDSAIMKSFDVQIRTLALIKQRFSVIHLETLQKALDLMSGLISKYYLAMHPGENVDELKLRVLDEGVEFEYRFRGQLAYPPRKYLSESHLNSLGIAAFLAAAHLFNKSSRFLVLDDVVTSFDSNHRLRLLRLLSERFSEWQILLLTHEPVWFEMIKKELAPRGWIISILEMLPSGSVHIELAPQV